MAVSYPPGWSLLSTVTSPDKSVEGSPAESRQPSPTIYYGLATPVPPETSPLYEPTVAATPSSGLPSPEVKRRKEDENQTHGFGGQTASRGTAAEIGSVVTHEDVSPERPTMMARSLPAMTTPVQTPVSL